MHGANPNVADNDGYTQLHKVCSQSYCVNTKNAIECLLKVGKCDPNIKNNAGLTPIQLIPGRSRNTNVLRELIKRGANPNVLDNDGNTLLHKMSENGDLD